MSLVHLVRHADAGDRGDWRGDDRLRPLSRRGWREAEAIAGLLSSAAVTSLLSSPYTRCRQTLEPLALARGLRVEEEGALVEGADVDAALALITRIGDAVLCSHGDVVGGVVLDLLAAGVPLHGEPRWEKASTWVLSVEAGRVVEGRRLPRPR